MRRILTLLGWVVGQPAAIAFLSPDDRDMVIISLALVVAVLVAAAVVRHYRQQGVRR